MSFQLHEWVFGAPTHTVFLRWSLSCWPDFYLGDGGQFHLFPSFLSNQDHPPIGREIRLPGDGLDLDDPSLLGILSPLRRQISAFCGLLPLFFHPLSPALCNAT
jgi:hypothetical protein